MQAGSKADAPRTAGVSNGTGLIPRKVLFSNPDKASPSLSPDGARIAFLAPVDGVLNVWVGPATDASSAAPVTQDTLRGIRSYFWAQTSEHILFVQDKGGDENWHVYCTDLGSGEVRDLTPVDGIAAMVSGVSELYPTQICLSINDRDPQLHDLYKVDILTGERELLLENPGLIGMVVDRQYRVRFGLVYNADGSNDYVVPTDAGWKAALHVPAEDTLTTSILGFDAQGGCAYFSDSSGRDTSALVCVDLTTWARTTLAASDRADLQDLLVHPTEHVVQAACFTRSRAEWQVLDPRIASDLKALAELDRGEMQVLSRTTDDSRWVVAFVEDAGPVGYYVWDRAPQQATFLFTSRAALQGLPLAPMACPVIKARDGLELVAYLTLPLGEDGAAVERPAAPLPMVLLVHGGPWARDTWGYHPYHQLLANRGYAVLSVNYRGSTGFGKAFINAANQEWGRRMHDDLLDSVEWAVAEGIADRSRVAIMGGSYGGYATLVGITMTPEVFACGVDLVGPSNLITFMETIPPYWMPMIQLLKDRVGDPDTEQGRQMLVERSPLSHVDRIQRPLLIAQGANDPRIKQSESDQIVAAMQAKHIPVTYLLYPDEGHGFARPENNMSYHAVSEAFLAQHLGGRFEPVGADFEGSSIQLVAGAGHIRGVDGAAEG